MTTELPRECSTTELRQREAGYGTENKAFQGGVDINAIARSVRRYTPNSRNVTETSEQTRGKSVKPCSTPVPRRGTPPTFVYFMYCAGRIKIGITTEIHGRHAGLSTACPLPITVLFMSHGDLQKEKEFHKRFEASRIIGEWFAFSPEIRAHLVEQLAGTVGGLSKLERAEAEFRAWLASEASPPPIETHPGRGGSTR